MARTQSPRTAASFLLLAVLTFSAGLVTAAPAAAAVAAEDCAEAAELTKLGDPGGAIEAIEGLRAVRPPRQGAEQACEAEYAEAALRRTSAVQLVEWANRLDEAAADSEGDATAPVPQPVPVDCSGELLTTRADLSDAEVETLVSAAVAAALTCDRHNEAAAGLAAAAAPSGDTVAQSSQSAWEKFRKAWLDPWVPLAIAFLVWTLIVLVLARLLLWLPRWTGNDLAALGTRRTWTRSAALLLGWTALLASGALVTGLWSLVESRADSIELAWADLVPGVIVATAVGLAFSPASRQLPLVFAKIGLAGLVVASFLLLWDPGVAAPLVPHVWSGAALALVAALALAAAWAAGARLTITSKGEGAPSLEYVRALATQLGNAPSRGVEIPVGTDTDVLASIGVAESPANPLVAAAVKAVQMERPPNPWQLTITAHNKELWSAELSRNHRVEASATISRSDLLATLEKPHDVVRSEMDLAPFAVALAVVTIASAQDRQPPGLAGATRWQSVGLQYLGSLRPRGDAAAQPLFASAVADDPDNILAQVSYWNALYRNADTVADLERYRSLLENVLRDPTVRKREPSLRQRVLYSRVAVGINLHSLGATDRNLTRRACLLHRAVTESDAPEPFLDNLRTNAMALLRSVPELASKLTDPISEPEKNGPTVNYSLGCYFATRNPACVHADAVRAARHLALADADPGSAAWRPVDPQLAAFRQSSQYRSEFGAPVPTDILAVAPFSEHADRFRGAGLVTLERVRTAGRSGLWQLGVRGPDASWVLALVSIGLAVSDDLEGWRVPIVGAFAAAGRTSFPANADAQAALRRSIHEACMPLKSSPSHGQIATWLSQQSRGPLVGPTR